MRSIIHFFKIAGCPKDRSISDEIDQGLEGYAANRIRNFPAILALIRGHPIYGGLPKVTFSVATGG